MAVYTKRVQSVLTDEQYRALVELSERTGKAVSVLIREAVEEVYLERQDRQRRQAALDRLLSLQAPVADWPQMEAEISEGATSS